MHEPGKPAVFVSYSHKDEEWKDALITHLRVLDSQGFVSLWDDRLIGAGEDWFKRIHDAIATADVAILLISANFLTSDFILREEIPALLRRRDTEGLRILPIIIKPCDWEAVSWLRQMNLRPKDGRPLSLQDKNQIDVALAAIAKELRGLLTDTALKSPGQSVKQNRPRVSVSRLPSTSRDLFGRDRELKILDKAWADPYTNVLVLVGWGGIGKSTLINRWVAEMARASYRGASLVYAWSFYSQGSNEQVVSADEFIDTVFRWLGVRDLSQESSWAKGERLAQLVRSKRTLLILDGLEPLQLPPGPREGRLKDPAIQALLRELAAQNDGLCVISTRTPVTDLANYEGNTVQQLELDSLLPEAGSQLLRAQGVKGNDEELREAAAEFDGHPLALTLLGGYLSDVHGGDITKRGEIRRLEEDLRHGGHARRVMASYENWFGEGPEVQVLRILGLFDRPIVEEVINCLRGNPPIAGLTDFLSDFDQDQWQRTLSKLRRTKLIAERNFAQPDMIDSHPLVREHFKMQLIQNHPRAWREGNGRLFDYYRNQAKEFPDTFEEMVPLYLAVTHGCQAGRYQEALQEVYWPRILRGDESFSVRKHGTFGADLVALSGFFERPWTKPVSAITEAEVGLILGQVGLFLWAQGQLAEAAEVARRALEIDREQKDLYAAALAARNLSQFHLTLGNLIEALDYARESVRLADQVDVPFEQIVTRTALGDALHLVGQFADAQIVFDQADELESQLDQSARLLWPKYSGLATISSSSSDRCFLYCDMLLDQGRYQEVKERAGNLLQEMQWTSALPIDVALIKLSLARAYIIESTSSSTNCLSQAADLLEDAIYNLRRAETSEFLVQGLFARAELRCLTGMTDQAQSDLDEALSIVQRGGMELYVGDCYLGYCRLNLVLKRKEDARAKLAIAKERLSRIGCKRRDREITEIESLLESI
ncbi:MAG TPA: TIR domain-containing protein [Blastocatellia bacterium]|nr:TIR domain-containing protein [Blastocatellia bacterium]